MRQDEQQESFKVYRLGRLRERYAADEIDVETYEREIDDVLHGRVPDAKGWATTYSLAEMRQWAAQQRDDAERLDATLATGTLVFAVGALVLILIVGILRAAGLL